jgi:phosphoribosylglycinamide formyltransferase 1
MPMALTILASHAGSTAGAVIEACARRRIDGQVVLVITNNRDAQVLDRARDGGVPTRHLSGATHPDPEALDAAILAATREVRSSHILLAGYMKRLGPQTLAAYEGRVFNTHPALLPDFGGPGMYGDRVHAAVLASGAARSGATVHLVTGEYDSGPIVAQVVVDVAAGDDVESLGARVRAAERELVVAVLAREASS